MDEGLGLFQVDLVVVVLVNILEVIIVQHHRGIDSASMAERIRILKFLLICYNIED